MKGIQILRVSPQEAALYSIQSDSPRMLSSSPLDSTPIISPSVSYNVRTNYPSEKVLTSDLIDHIHTEEFYASESSPEVENVLKKEEGKEIQKEKEVKKHVSSFFSQVVLPGSIGGAAGTATGLFLLPGVGLLSCAIIGGLGLTTLANLSKAWWKRYQVEHTPLTKESKPLDL